MIFSLIGATSADIQGLSLKPEEYRLALANRIVSSIIAIPPGMRCDFAFAHLISFIIYELISLPIVNSAMPWSLILLSTPVNRGLFSTYVSED